MTDQLIAESAPTNAASKRKWYRRTWAVAIAAGLIGIGIGAASGGSDPKQSDAYKTVVKQRDEAKGALVTTNNELAKAQSDLKTIAGTLPDREAAVSKKESELSTREGDIKAREAAVKKREDAVSKTEQVIEDNTLSGDGVYEVGTDIKAGTYKTHGAPGCYYAILNSSDTSDIADNNNTDGPATVSVRNGQFLELSGCDDFVLQQ